MAFNVQDLLINNETSTARVNDFEFEVKKYLPMEDKIDLIQIALQKAEEDGIYNEMLLEVFFNLNIIYLYTDIEIPEEMREDELKLYDLLNSNDIIDCTIAFMDKEEYEELLNYLTTMKTNILTYKNTAASVIKSIIQDLPKNAEAAAKIVEEFDPDKYKAVRDFANAANGNRDIRTQQPVPAQKYKVTSIED